LEYTAIEVPRQAFPGMVEAFLSEDRTLYLIVEGIMTVKEIGCSGQYCTEILKVAPPDSNHAEVTLQKPTEGDFIEREYKCKHDHITKVYWYRRPLVIGSV